MPTKLATTMAGVLIMAVLSACQPTGSTRCDAEWDLHHEIEQAGYRLDCAPDFPNVAGSGPRAGQAIKGWTDHDRKTVWVWPDSLETKAKLRRTLLHELAHAKGLHGDELGAERYAVCRQQPYTTEAECAAEVGL